MTNEKYTLGEAFLVILVAAMMVAVAFLLMLPIGLLLAWVRVKLWVWFVVPYFHLPVISFWEMYALSILIGTFVNYSKPTAKEEPKPGFRENAVSMCTNVGGWLLALGIGYLIHHYGLA